MTKGDSVMRRSRTILTGLLLAATWLAGGAVRADDECRVRYSWATGFNQSQQDTVDIDRGDTKTINRNGALKVENLKANPIRVYRSGIGSYVDLDEDQSDPAIAAYPPGVTLQKVKCLEASSGSQSPTQQAVNAFFSAVSSFADPILNQLGGWKSQAQQAAAKGVEDWGSCPSPGAQTTYNQIETRRDQIQQSINAANAMKQQAEEALAACKSSFNNSPMCTTAYNTLALHAAITSLEGAKSTLNAALNTLKSLKCPQGCQQAASVNVPTPALQSQGAWSLTNPGWVDVDVCTRVDLGSLGVDTAALASGQLNQLIEAEPPSCSRSERFSICTNWDLAKLLALLQRLELVPPEVGSIEVDVPTREVRVFTGLQSTSCQAPLRVCVPGGNVTISVNEGASLFNGSYNACASYQTLGCQTPPFGLAPQYTTVEIPDVTRATVRWTGRKPGSVELDLSRRDFRNLCLGRGRTSLSIPKPPKVVVKNTQVNLPFLCVQPNWVNVVANP
jgi:hypothetical protein